MLLQFIFVKSHRKVLLLKAEALQKWKKAITQKGAKMSHFLTDVEKIEWKLWTTEWKVVARGIGFHLEGRPCSLERSEGCNRDPRGENLSQV